MPSDAAEIERLRAAFDARLRAYLDERRSELPEAIDLLDEVERTLGAGGKRLRPAFCYWGHVAAGGIADDRIIRAAASLELLHTFALVHDDVMDNANERRGEPTVHAKRGPNVAILVGDMALVLADDALMGSGFDEKDLHRAFDVYSRMRRQVIAGQYLDLEAAHSQIDERIARRIAVLKSGSYSIEQPLLMGATLGGASDDVLRDLSAFGSPLGEAFQLRDDLLGTFGQPSITGKSVDSDIREGKRHVLYTKALDGLEGEDRDFFVARWGGSFLSDVEVRRLRSLLETSGARAGTEELVVGLLAQAVSALEKAALDERSREALGALADLATKRSA
ncbi:MAG: polyprenyl synthetase family protein [Actinobacteria bacterium]|nr:polyprenyl synthetase family protein [Actinomycetota bacterium]